MKIKPIPKLLLTVVFTLICSVSMAQFPYFQSFKNASAANIVFGGAPTAILTAAQGIDPVGDGYLRLTNSNTNQKGYIYSTENFTTGTGLSISFEYYTYGGSGADGICFFLFDAAVGNAFNIGGFGGSLGYAQFDSSISLNTPGVSKGYLGVAIDEFGNFSNERDGRQGGVIGNGLFGISPKSVTLRGKGDGAARTPGNYQFLTQVTASDKGVDLVNDASIRFPNNTEIGFRKAFIDLKPNPSGGFNVSVRIQVGGSPTKTTTVVDNYYYPEAPPSLVRYGISSSTGDLTNFHEIRNVSINPFTIPFTDPKAVDDNLTECPSKTSTINIIANDVSTNSGVSLNPASIDLDPFVAGIQKTFIVGGKGAFTVSNSGIVTFTPFGPFTGSVSCKYVISDDLGYTSTPATVTIAEPTNPILANAGAAQLIHISAATGSANIVGNLPTGTAGVWSIVSGPTGNAAVISNPTSATTTVTNMTNGTYIFKWTLTVAGQCDVSANVQVVVNAIPVAINDSKPGVVNTPLLIDILANDTDRDGNSTINKTKVVIVSNPLHGTVTKDPLTGVVTYTPTTGYIGADSFTYTVEDNQGAVSNIATVNITIPAPPKIGLAKSSIIEKLSDGSFNVKFLFTIKNYSSETLQNITLKDDLATTFAGANFSVVSRASVGTVSFLVRNDFNGTSITEMLQANNQLLSQETAKIELVVNVKLISTLSNFTNIAFTTGTPISGGPAVADQSTNGLIPDPTTANDVTPDVPTPVDFPAVVPPKIGLAKSLVSLDEQADKSYNVKFLFTIKNYGDATLQNISLKDDLALAFAGTQFSVVSIASVGTVNFLVRNEFNGTTTTEMLQANNQLLSQETAKIELVLNVKLLGAVFKFLNTAITEGTPDTGGPKVTDTSMNGLNPDPNTPGDVTPSDPTPIDFPAPPIFIPEGFSPNGDGTNDFFVIPNGALTPLDLEIYNRWGNVVYKSVNYTNNWDGKSNKGLYIGQDLPSGTYYYIVRYNSLKYVGFITLNR